MNKHTMFAVAHTDIRQAPFNNNRRTLRTVIDSNVSAPSLSVRFANYYSAGKVSIGAATLAKCNEDGVITPETSVPITVNGKLMFELEKDEPILSDTLPFEISPHEHFAISIFYPMDEPIVSGNWLGNQTFRSRPGNFTTCAEINSSSLIARFARTLVDASPNVATTSVCEIIAHCAKPHHVLACFGDSITQQNNWTGPFKRSLYQKYPGEISVCNVGISGNRLLQNSAASIGGLHGEAGILRFKRDVLNLQGVTHAIIALGLNDLGLPGTHGIPNDEVISFEEYTKAMTNIAAQLKKHGIKSFASTMTPRIIDPPYDDAREQLRLQMNSWVRNNACFDEIIDFDAALRRDDGLSGMRQDAALPDGLHPSAIGGLWMAKAINLAPFGEALK